MDKFLNHCRTRSNNHTHVSMGQYKGKYQLSRDNLEDFFNQYDTKKHKLCLAEKPQHYTPILVDIDIKRNKDTMNNVSRSDQHIIDVVKSYQKVLKTIINDLQPKD